MTKGLFITLEGGEGSGKSTVANVVSRKLLSMGYNVIITREPGGTFIAEAIREIILNKNDNEVLVPEAEALLFAAARAQHLQEKIQPALNRGTIVLCDRWLSSSLAYQGWARTLGVDAVLAINDFGIRGKRPDLEFFLDIPPAIGLQRIKTRGEMNRLDKEDLIFHEQVYSFFHHNSKKNDYVHVVDGTLSIDEIAEIIVNKIIMAAQEE